MLRLHLNLSIQLFTGCPDANTYPRPLRPHALPQMTTRALTTLFPSLTLSTLHSFPARPSALRSASPILAFSPRPPCLPSPAHPLCLVATPSPYLSHPLLSILSHSYSHFTPYPTSPFLSNSVTLGFCKGLSLHPLLSHLKAVTVSYAPVFAPSDR
jgi:hypothetical protein